MEPDFSGYATKAGLKCSDGRTITPEAFKHMDGKKVPLVWQHGHDSPANILGHAVLESRDDGVYAYGYFNSTDSAKNAKELVEHKDISFLSIYANQLVEKSKNVLHGFIKEVSLVLAGANPGALIDNVRIVHSDDDVETLDDEAVIFTGLTLEHGQKPGEKKADVKPDDKKTEDVQHAEDGEETVQDIYDTFDEKQKDVVHYMVGEALKAAGVKHADDNKDDLTHTEGTEVVTNVFDKSGGAQTSTQARPTLTHDQLKTIVDDAKKMGSFKESFLAHAVEYGIENIDFLFPDAKTLQNSPEWISRRMEWVSKVINGARKSPFSRIKTMSADITHDEARAKGYVKGTLKKEEWFALAKRVTTPSTIYKKQKLDRDDIIDITDLDVVAWLKAEMRLMLDEEIARAVLVGDGREVDDEDKINETNIRPIAHDDEFYTHKVVVAANVTGDALVEAVLRARPTYRGSGNPSMFCTEDFLTDLLLVKDKMGRRLYDTQADLERQLRVKEIVTVDAMAGQQVDGGDLLCVLVNMADYTIGADKGGAIAMFDDFDIDYNQYKYLIETRISGTLTKFKSAQVVTRAGGTEVDPDAPTFNPATGIVTIPAETGVTYKNRDTNATLVAGPQAPLAPGDSLDVVAVPNTGYYFPHNTDADWLFTRPAA